MKYEVVTLNVTIQGKKFLKGVELDDSKISKKLLNACYRDGAIKPKGTKANNPFEVVKQYKAAVAAAEKAKADEAAKAVAAAEKAKAPSNK